MNEKKKRLLQYGINGVIAVGIAFLVAWYELDLVGFTSENWIRFLCDGFFVSAVLYIGFGLLSVIAAAGNFYGISYVFSSVMWTFLPSKERFEKRKTYYDYVLEKKAKRLENKEKFPGRMLIVGIVCFAISMGFLLIFETYFR